MNFMRDGQPLCGLHQGQHELAFNQPRLGQAIGAHIIVQVGLTCDGDGGEVIKHHREVLINQGAHEHGQSGTEFLAVLIEHIHGAQQVLMLRIEPKVCWQGHRLQPAQHTEFAARVAQTIEEHQAQAGQDINLHF